MKMVKSLLLGSAAGLVAVAGAQAADLPVKAKPVEYVKVCSLYGAGFYYMPGTDICIKLGGFVRFQAYSNNGTSPSNGPFVVGGYQTRQNTFANDFTFRSRAVLTIDTRQQTEYGTLRTYTLFGFNGDTPGSSSGALTGSSPGNALYATRGFIQLAGFTLGKAQSFYDIYSTPATSYFGLADSDTGDAGVLLAGYTAQFGNGFTGTLSLEDPRRVGVVNSSLQSATNILNPFTLAAPVLDTNNFQWPDVVGVLRVDQAWGSAQVMAAAHQVGGAYYGTTLTGATISGHPSDKVGWAVGAGTILNTDFISRGDKFWFQINYTKGAAAYADFTPGRQGNAFLFGSGNSVGWGLNTDAIYGGTNGSLELTTLWGVNAAYDHVWNERWKTDVYGGYLNYSYSGAAQNYIAASACNVAATNTNGSLVAMSNCNPDWSQWYIGSRTQFNINSSTYLGLDVMYRKLNTGFGGTASYLAAANTPRPSGAYKIEDQDALSVTFRVHRDFLP